MCTPPTFGFRTNAAPPLSKELNPFEHELYETIASIKHHDRKRYSPYQNKLLKCVREIQNSDKIFLLADKTSNVYTVSKELYNKLLINNVTKDYKLVDEGVVEKINKETTVLTVSTPTNNTIDYYMRQNGRRESKTVQPFHQKTAPSKKRSSWIKNYKVR